MSASQLRRMPTGNVFTFFATLGGVVFGVLLSVAITGPMLQSKVAEATQNATHTIVATPANYADACVAPTSQTATGGTGNNVTATQSTPVPGGRGGDAPMPQPPHQDKIWVHKFVSGVWATNTGTISNTGSDSTNTVTAVNKNTTHVQNTNNVNVVNNNSQSADSGDVDSHNNTTSGGGTSGTASNTSKSEFDITLIN